MSSVKVPIVQGNTVELTVKAVRKNGFEGAIALSAVSLPEGASMKRAEIAADEDETTIELSAADDAPHSLPSKVEIHGESSNLEASTPITVTVCGHPGALDTSFQEGRVIVPVGAGDDYANAMALTADEKILVAGRIAENYSDFGLIRLERDGSLDTSFGKGGKVSTPIGERGPDAESTGLAASDAESMAEAAAADEAGNVTDAPLRDADGAPDPATPEQVVAAAPEVTAGGRLEVTERAAGPSAAGGNGTAPLLDIRNLVKEYPITSGAILQRRVSSVKAVSDVSFSVPAGTTFGLVGESGCGKTTIGKMIVALERPNSGAVTLGGVDMSKLRGSELRRKRRDLQLMFQDPHSSLDPRMRVGTIIGEPLAVQRLGSKKAQRERVFELLSEVGLPRNAVERYPHEFSGGQRQRIGLARALTLNPRLIVADEPVSALDVSIRAQVLNLMKRLQASHGLTYVVISHDLAVVKYMAERIGVMYLGKLVEIGSAQDIYERSAHPYTAGLIATIPVPDPATERGKEGVAIKGELPSPVNPPSGCRFRTRCPFAQERCADEEPELRSFGPGHVAACHFPLQSPSAAETDTAAMTSTGGQPSH